MTIIRTKRLGCYEPKRNAFGGYFLQVDDPDFTPEIDEEDIASFHIDPDFPRIPAKLWQRWARLCIDLAAQHSQLEVSMRLLRADDDPSQYRIVIPVQSVSSGHVHASFDHSRDIETGESIGLYPPCGWHGIGSCHSHHTMTITFSAGDDASELNDPGLHLLIRSIDVKTNRYMLDASITTAKRRFLLHWKDVVDAIPVPGITYHPDVMQNITTAVSYSDLADQNHDYTAPFVRKSLKTSHSPWHDPQWDNWNDFYDCFHDDPIKNFNDQPSMRQSLIDSSSGRDYIHSAFEKLSDILDFCIQTEDEPALELIKEELLHMLDMREIDLTVQQALLESN